MMKHVSVFTQNIQTGIILGQYRKATVFNMFFFSQLFYYFSTENVVEDKLKN